MNAMYESKLSARRWIAYDLPGNVGWIVWTVCLFLLLKQGVTWFSVLAIIPAILMLIGVIELISERMAKLDWVLPKARLYRGFGSLTLGGVLGIPVVAAGLIAAQGHLCWWMLAGACLCALFAWLIFREYHPQRQEANKMKPDYQNWVPKPMVTGLWTGTLLALILFILFGATGLILHGTTRLICAIVLGVGVLAMLFFSVWMTSLYRAFDYNGKRKMAKTIIDGTAKYVRIPKGGVGLDVGCGSGALTIACSKQNPKASMVGCDIWSGAYKAVFSQKRCEDNAAAEGVPNVRFQEGNAVRLPFGDETFDAVTSNYVYHNIAGVNKQDLLLETLRVLKKGGTFAIHDLMSKARYGDMDAFIRKLKEMGYAEVRLIDTADGTFMGKKEAAWLGLGGSTLLIGRK